MYGLYTSYVHVINRWYDYTFDFGFFSQNPKTCDLVTELILVSILNNNMLPGFSKNLLNVRGCWEINSPKSLRY